MTSAQNRGAIPTIEVRHRLRIAREFAGLDQEQLAERMEVVRSTISNAETGKVKPSRSTIRNWALCCGVPREWILTGSPPDGGGGGGGGGGVNVRTWDYKKRTSGCCSAKFRSFRTSEAVSSTERPCGVNSIQNNSRTRHLSVLNSPEQLDTRGSGCTH